MINLEIPGFGDLNIRHAVFDYNGTLAKDGYPVENVIKKLLHLNDFVKIHILTADTFGRVKKEFDQFSFNIQIITSGNESAQKKKFIDNLGSASVVCFGNGNNDVEMLKSSALGIGVIGGEGISSKVMQNADIIVNNILDGIDLLLDPLRLKATLRN